MGVHGVVMIEIANHQGIDGREFREEANQNALGVHGAEGVGGVGRDQNLLQVRPEIGDLRAGGCQRGGGGFYFLLGFAA